MAQRHQPAPDDLPGWLAELIYLHGGPSKAGSRTLAVEILRALDKGGLLVSPLHRAVYESANSVVDAREGHRLQAAPGYPTADHHLFRLQIALEQAGLRNRTLRPSEAAMAAADKETTP